MFGLTLCAVSLNMGESVVSCYSGSNPESVAWYCEGKKLKALPLANYPSRQTPVATAA